ncbi:Rhamnogalacturonan acetylesterase precursor [Haloferax volcanii DSM 14919]|uniref:Rhamnogalacturonan acetylesterase n=1 Tax=Haloferax lucentense (strain DSM 14919 / JCM 9276 / NCIMB 13854 / Aa 2.2) TaxID=1230452 RepID=M0GGI0_HALL2|nr:rhamnogalacturonan acetylesterase [Haloferax lucentense]ELZ70627.1 Rhamnogalacturonan acetylesterase precursor [Haloferax lucentense DSM 14919]
MSSESITVHLVGDSTMADKEAHERPETGWGMPFADRFDDAVTVANHARNGRSTRTFLEEGRWRPVARQLTETDYVFVQFGHNDEVPSKEQHTTEAAFVDNLRKFVGETREQGATPVLLTPIARRQFDDDGVPKDTHRAYADLTRTVALDRDVPLIDMDERTRALLAELGPDASTALYNHLEPGEHSNYPEGIADDTHFSEHGARRMADVVLDGVAELDLGLAAHVES